jgi:hypothetical protein
MFLSTTRCQCLLRESPDPLSARSFEGAPRVGFAFVCSWGECAFVLWVSTLYCVILEKKSDFHNLWFVHTIQGTAAPQLNKSCFYLSIYLFLQKLNKQCWTGLQEQHECREDDHYRQRSSNAGASPHRPSLWTACPQLYIIVHPFSVVSWHVRRNGSGRSPELTSCLPRRIQQPLAMRKLVRLCGLPFVSLARSQ